MFEIYDNPVISHSIVPVGDGPALHDWHRYSLDNLVWKWGTATMKTMQMIRLNWSVVCR